jgi:phosphatidate cytidylyltransferase
MLKTRVITALVLLAVLLPVLYSDSFIAFILLVTTFFAAACWENFRLFNSRHPGIGAGIWTSAFVLLVFNGNSGSTLSLSVICLALWVFSLVPSLARGLPAQNSLFSRLLGGIYGICILGCFMAIVALYQHSPFLLLSVMGIVWIADIGAYFSGKAFGKHKLALSISPGKSWEGAIGGWVAVMLAAVVSTQLPQLNSTFSAKLQTNFGWLGLIAGMTLLVVASIIGDLFESLLKRRANMKDSSKLLPGHGGVLDRIDALIPVLPLATLFSAWL